ncbi:MAG: rhodanese-like domain-containing protein [Desulfitobacteriaceae bacterium]
MKEENGVVLILVLAVIFGLTGCGQSGTSSNNNQAAPQNAADQSIAQTDKAPGNTPGTSPATSSDAEVPATSETGNASGATGHGSAGLPADSMISASQLDQGLKEHQSWHIIDVREPSEFASGHVPTAKDIPLGKLEENLSQILKDQTVVLVDLNGTRSYTAWQKLKEKGYDANKLKVLVGGMEQWKTLGSGEITESIGGC